MKNILNTLGSKKVIGTVLVMGTLAVGLGVVSNFSGNDQKRTNDAALSNFNDNSYNNFYGNTASRADLERQLSLGQDSNTARFFRGNSTGMDEDDAFSADGAYGEGVRSDEGFVYGDSYGPNGSYGRGAQGAQGGAAGSYDPSNPMATGGGVRGAYDPSGEPIYVQGTRVDDSVSPYGTSYGEGAQGTTDVQGANSTRNTTNLNVANGGKDQNGTYMVKGKKSVNTFTKKNGSNADAEGAAGAAGAAGKDGEAGTRGADAKGAKGANEAVTEAAAKAAKAKQARERANRMRRETQINKLADATGGSSWGNLSGANFSGGSMGSYGDSGGRPLQSADGGQANGGKVDAFRFGRAGSMGGYNVANGNGSNSTGDRGKGLDALNSALYAQRASLRGSRSKVSEGAKRSAEEAFDGSGGDDGGALISDGASIQKAASQLGDPSINPSSPKSPNLGPAVTNLAGKREKLEQLQEKWKDLYWSMILASLVLSGITAFMAIMAKVLMNSAVPWVVVVGVILFVLAILLALVNIAYIWQNLFGFSSEADPESLIGLIREMHSEELAPVNEDLKWYHKEWLSWTTGGILGVVGILALFTGTSVLGEIGTIGGSVALGLSGNGLVAVITGVISALFGIAGGGGAIEEMINKEEEKDENGTNGGDGGSGGGSGGGN